MSQPTLFRFDVEERRTATIWVEADTLEAATADAEVLADEIGPADWHDVDTDLDVWGECTPTETVTVWSGGSDGREYVYNPAEGES